MTRESSSEGELSELVPDHILSDEYWSMNLSVVHTECVSDELRDYCTVTSPYLDDGLLTALIELLDLLDESRIDVRSLFKTSCHRIVVRS